MDSEFYTFLIFVASLWEIKVCLPYIEHEIIHLFPGLFDWENQKMTQNTDA